MRARFGGPAVGRTGDEDERCVYAITGIRARKLGEAQLYSTASRSRQL